MTKNEVTITSTGVVYEYDLNLGPVKFCTFTDTDELYEVVAKTPGYRRQYYVFLNGLISPQKGSFEVHFNMNDTATIKRNGVVLRTVNAESVRALLSTYDLYAQSYDKTGKLAIFFTLTFMS